MTEQLLEVVDPLDPLAPGAWFEFEIDGELSPIQQLLLQQQLRAEINAIIRGQLSDFISTAGTMLPTSVSLVEVTVRNGSVKIWVRYTWATTASILLGIAGCQTLPPSPSYSKEVTKSLNTLVDAVPDRVQQGTSVRILAMRSGTELGAIARIDQILSDAQRKIITIDDAAQELIGAFEKIQSSPQRTVLVHALTEYLNRVYGDDLFSDLRERLGENAHDFSVDPADLLQIVYQVPISIVIQFSQPQPPPEDTFERIREIIRSEFEQEAHNSDWPVIGAIQHRQYGYAVYGVFLFMGALGSFLECWERFKRLRDRVLGRVVPELERQLNPIIIQMHITVRPSDRVVDIVQSIIAQIPPSPPIASDLAKAIEQASSTETTSDKEDLKSIASGI